MRALGECVRLPVAVTHCEWMLKQVRTRIPPAPVHQEWRLDIGFRCDEPLRVAAMLVNHDLGQLHHVRPSPEAAPEACYRIDFFPYDWDHSEDVQINVMGARVAVTNQGLTRQPNVVAKPVVENGDILTTGVVTDLVVLGDSAWTAQVALVAQRDTKKDRTRWRILAGQGDASGPYAFLWSGRRSGCVRIQ